MTIIVGPEETFTEILTRTSSLQIETWPSTVGSQKFRRSFHIDINRDFNRDINRGINRDIELKIEIERDIGIELI
jgi:hypothetical protein